MEHPSRVLTPVRPDLGIRDRIDLFKATRIGAADLNEPQLPLGRKLTLALGLAGIAACGGNTVDSTTTTPPTTIESTTTVPTTIPETTTTTTVPETTTTTEAEYPFNLPRTITMPTGEIKDPETGNNMPLGIISIEPTQSSVEFPNGFHREWTIDMVKISGRLTRLYKVGELNSRGNTVEYGYIDIVVGPDSKGNAIIFPIKINPLSAPLSITVSSDESNSVTYSLELGKVSDLFDLNTELGRYFNDELSQYAQIIIEVPLEEQLFADLISDPRACNPLPFGDTTEQCLEIISNHYNNVSVNTKLVEILSKNPDDRDPSDLFTPDDYGIHPTYPTIYPSS